MGFIEGLHEADIDLFRAMNLAGSNQALDVVMVFFTILGISYVIAIVSVPLWISNKRESTIDVLVLIVIVTVLTELIKILVDRPRPLDELTNVNTILSASGPSFPSAHASRAFAVAALLFLRVPRRSGILAVVIASLIAVSRVYLGVHWPTDVLAGAVLGIILAYLFNSMCRSYVPYISFRKRIIDSVARVGV